MRHKLYRSRTDSKLTGLCGGLAEWFGVDPTIVRVLLVVTAFFSFGTVLLVYLICSVVIPKNPYGIMPPAGFYDHY